MDYLIDCTCGHDLSRHDDTGCRGNDSNCACDRTKLQALDTAIDEARMRPYFGTARTAWTDTAEEKPRIA